MQVAAGATAPPIVKTWKMSIDRVVTNLPQALDQQVKFLGARHGVEGGVSHLEVKDGVFRDRSAAEGWFRGPKIDAEAATQAMLTWLGRELR